MYWLFEIGAGICDMMTGCLIALDDVSGLGLSWQWENIQKQQDGSSSSPVQLSKVLIALCIYQPFKHIFILLFASLGLRASSMLHKQFSITTFVKRAKHDLNRSSCYNIFSSFSFQGVIKMTVFDAVLSLAKK